MNYRVTIQKRAEDDLRENVIWWSENRSPNQAARWYRGILAAVEELGDNPRRFPLASENGDFFYELREAYFGLSGRPTHRIVFTIGTTEADSDKVYVLTIRHIALDDLSPDSV
jgi:plasmid stabilization system protein ParE